MDKLVITSEHDKRFKIHVYENGLYFTKDDIVVEDPNDTIPRIVFFELCFDKRVKEKRGL